MSLRVAVQMDPIESVNIESDTTFLMALEAQARGHQLWIHGPEKLALENGRVRARARRLTVRPEKGDHYTMGEAETLDLHEDVDVILLRQDPPFDMAYVTSTYMLELVTDQTLVVNNPAEVRSAPEKLFAQHFPDLQPPTLITADIEQLVDFHQRHGDVVLKPLHGNAGSGVVKLKAGDPNLPALMDLHRSIQRDPVVIQAFVPAVVKGDKRIILVDGEVVGAINRVPPEGSVRSNLGVGGSAQPVELTARDREICATVGPELRKRGLIFVGLDVIGGYLTEINVTSPTGAQQMKRFGAGDAAAALWDAVAKRLGA